MTTAGTRLVDHVVAAAWVVTIAILALGHLTAVRNVVTVAVALLSLALYARDWRAIPCKTVALAVLALAAASLLWSAAPAVTWSKWRTDLAIPLLAGAGCFVFVRATGRFEAIVAGAVLGLVFLASFSVFAYGTIDVPPGIPFERTAGIVRPLPRWYPGPGDASMFAIFALIPLYIASRAADASSMRRAVLAAGWLLLAFVLVTTNNRNAVLVAPFVLLLMWLLDRRSAHAPSGASAPATTPAVRAMRFARWVVIVLLLVATVGAALEWGARERLRYLRKPMQGDSAAIALASADTRPAIWRYYARHGLEHPWLGMGFGRTVPGIGWETESDKTLSAVEPNAYIHAHNLLLNWWLQLGVAGVALLVAAAVTIERTARRLRDAATASASARTLYVAVVGVLTATLLRNLTDDFLVFGMATMFCVVTAALLGEASRLASAQASEPRTR